MLTCAMRGTTKAIQIGLTGSIGMGKSAISKQFQMLGFPVFDADAVVHDLYAFNGEGVTAVQKLVPEAVTNGSVDRKVLGQKVLQNSSLLKELENVIHPLVANKRKEFYQASCRQGYFLVVYDIPLLLENNSKSKEVDYIVVVTASETTQRERVLARPGMSIDKFQSILSKQLPDEEKRKRADFIINTDFTEYSSAKAQVAKIIESIIDANPEQWNHWKTKNLPSSSSSSSSLLATTLDNNNNNNNSNINLVSNENSVDISNIEHPSISTTTITTIEQLSESSIKLSDYIDIVVFDLDDTLSRTFPPILAAQKAVNEFLLPYMPRTTQLLQEGKLANEMKGVVQDNPLLSHDLTEVRRTALTRLAISQNEHDVVIINQAMEILLRVRSDVVAHCYEDSIPCLQWLKNEQRVKVGVLTNGNANLMDHAPGLFEYLNISLTAGEVGASKPSVVPFLALLQRVGVKCASRVLFIGDSYSHDIIGAHRCGMRTVLLLRDENSTNNNSNNSNSNDNHNNNSATAVTTIPATTSTASSESLSNAKIMDFCPSAATTATTAVITTHTSTISSSSETSSSPSLTSNLSLETSNSNNNNNHKHHNSNHNDIFSIVHGNNSEMDEPKPDIIMTSLDPDHFISQWKQYMSQTKSIGRHTINSVYSK